jgi:hypothetical protein
MAAVGIGFYSNIGVYPNGDKDLVWRKAAGWGYPFTSDIPGSSAEVVISTWIPEMVFTRTYGEMVP